MAAEQRERLQIPITLKDAIIGATFRPGRVYEGPDVIDLATLQQDAEELIDYTLSHPKRHEAGRLVLVGQDNKVTTNRKIIEGENGYVAIPVTFEVNRGYSFVRRLSQDKFVGAEMHSHPSDKVYSARDLTHILAKDSLSDASTSSLLITPKRKLLIFRGKNTPQLDEEDIVLNLNSMIAVVDKAVKLGITQSWLPNVDKIKKNTARRFFRDLARGYDLQVFEGKVRDRFLHRVAADQIAE